MSSSSGPAWNVPWSDLLKAAHAANHDTSRYDRGRGQPLLASVRADGTARVQPLTFLDFLGSDPRVLLLAGAARSQELVQAVKTNQSHELCWLFARSRESFTLAGKAALVCSGALAGRFGSGPRNIALPDPLPVWPAANPFPPTADDFWQRERDRLWRALAPDFRAAWTWPSPGEPRAKALSSASMSTSTSTSTSAFRGSVTALPTSFAIKTLDVVDGAGPNEETRLAHMAAYDNFCLVVFRVTKVEHYIYDGKDGIPERNVYSAARDGQWVVESLNPY
ncbi:hypothetical protein BDR26DRAFT_817287 [Obelidium mucronatum]|nr:hypothetical protein BDR26DRAFT_817287 [Obelidium mucronatum]